MDLYLAEELKTENCPKSKEGKTPWKEQGGEQRVRGVLLL